jgi:hypothetical protein
MFYVIRQWLNTNRIGGHSTKTRLVTIQQQQQQQQQQQKMETSFSRTAMSCPPRRSTRGDRAVGCHMVWKCA